MSVELVVIGASLGGLDALSLILGEFPAPLGAAVVIVQHRRADPTSHLAELLGGRGKLPVREPQDREIIRADHVYLAPSDYHLLIDGDHFAFSTEGPVSWARPSIDVLFESAAESHGGRALGVVLTGASVDGAAGAAAMAEAGAKIVVQDPDTAESPIAPRAVIASVPQAKVLPLDRIGAAIIEACRPGR